MDALVFLEMVEFLSDRVAVALADVETENSGGGFRIGGIYSWDVVRSINTEV